MTGFNTIYWWFGSGLLFGPHCRYGWDTRRMRR